MESMIEHTTGFKVIISIILQPLMVGLIALGWWPTTDFIILQVNDYFLLNPVTKIIFEESRIILGDLISAAILIKIILGIVFYKKEK